MNKKIAIEEKNRLFLLIGIETYNIINFKNYTDYEILKTIKQKVKQFAPEIDKLNQMLKESD